MGFENLANTSPLRATIIHGGGIRRYAIKFRPYPWNYRSNAKCSEGCRRIGNQPSLLRRARTQTNTGPDRQAKRMKRILRRCLRLFHVASLTLILRIELLAGAGEDREDLGRFQSRVHRLESAIGRQRQKLGIPGLAIVVVNDDRMIRTKGFGYRDIEKRLLVTSDSLFGIGSCTKAFTGAAAVMSAEAGKLSLDDSPRRFLPYFRLADPAADAQATLKDLLTHRTGLTAYDDDVWHKNDKLSREEVIKAVMSKPATARFRTAFQYNNVMYSAVGECIGRANDSTWEGVISNSIFKPLGMKASNTGNARLA